MRSEDCVAVGVVPTFTPISLEEGGGSVTQESSAVTCCLSVAWNVLGGNVSFACARLCSFLLVFFLNMLYSHLPPADLAGRKHTGCISRKSNNERLVKEREKINSVYFNSNTSFSCCLFFLNQYKDIYL